MLLTKVDVEKYKFLILLVLADVFFISLHILGTYTRFFTTSYFSIGQEWGYGEVFQYIKEMWIAALLFFLGARKRSFLYLSFSLVFVYFFLDDSFEFHERLGSKLAGFFAIQPKFGLQSADFGELIVSGSFGAVFSLFIGIGYWRSDRAARVVSKIIIMLILVLAFFGVLIDMVHSMLWFKDAGPMVSIVAVIEDGGEMLVMSVITWFVFRLNLTEDETPVSAVS